MLPDRVFAFFLKTFMVAPFETWKKKQTHHPETKFTKASISFPLSCSSAGQPSLLCLTTVRMAFSRQPGLGFQARAVAELHQHYPARWEGTSSSAPTLKTFPFLQFFWLSPYVDIFIFTYCSVLFLASIFLQIAQLKFSASSAIRSYEKVRQRGAHKVWSSFFQLSLFYPYPVEGPLWGFSLVLPRTIFKLSKIFIHQKIKIHILPSWDF